MRKTIFVVSHYRYSVINMLLTFAMKHTALALVLLCVVSNVGTQFVAEPKPNMSKKEAVKQCSEKGSKLLNNKQIITNPSVHEYLNQLNDGESAWIEGYAELSPFLAWQGCYNTSVLKISILTRAIRYKSVNRCLRECPNYPYIGLKDTSCYCINDNQRSAIQYEFVNESFCSIPCHNNVIDSCGGQSYMSVYGIVDDRRINWAAHEPSSHLCVYVKRKLNRFDVHTTSCHTPQSFLINGYICASSAWSRLSVDNCDSATHTGLFCIIEKFSTRKEAVEGCLMERGALADLGAETPTHTLLKDNFRYWIGIHRTFGIAEHNIFKKSELVCLSATRLGNVLLLEPDDCSAQKFYLCESNSSGVTTTLSFSRKTEKRVPDTNETFMTNTTSPDQGTDTNDESIIPFIVPSVLMAIFIILLILFIAYRRNKKRKP